MAAPRTVLVLTSDPDGPVVRHRFRYFEEVFEARGIALEFGPWPKARGVRRETLERAARADAVVVSSRLLAPRDVSRLRTAAKRLAFDFDDALPFRDSAHGATRSRTRDRRFRAIVAASDRVTAGNAYLAGLAREAGRVATVLPTVVRMDDADPPAEPATEPPLLGWIGSRATLPYLEALGTPLAHIHAGGRAFYVRVIADARPSLPNSVPIDFVEWTIDGWRDALACAHVGLAPLPDDPWTRGKCGLKLLQVCAVGRPVVASAVGVQAEQVLDGETGYLAPDDASFIRGVGRLLGDPLSRRTMGARAHAFVRERWSVRAWAGFVGDEVEALLAGEHSGDAA